MFEPSKIRGALLAKNPATDALIRTFLKAPLQIEKSLVSLFIEGLHQKGFDSFDALLYLEGSLLERVAQKIGKKLNKEVVKPTLGKWRYLFSQKRTYVEKKIVLLELEAFSEPFNLYIIPKNFTRLILVDSDL